MYHGDTNFSLIFSMYFHFYMGWEHLIITYYCKLYQFWKMIDFSFYRFCDGISLLKKNWTDSSTWLEFGLHLES